MQKVFDEVNSLDKKCYEQFALSEDILMEHAATSILNFIENNFETKSKILIACGVGNNGADGITLARLLYKKYEVILYIPFGIKSPIGKVQLKRVELLGLCITEQLDQNINNYDVVVDCLFGSGLNRELDLDSKNIIDKLNDITAYKIACDIPSGINKNGNIDSSVFKANTTITMGALKKSLFTDEVKDFIGDINVANLGVQRELYEEQTDTFILDIEDIKPPFRKSNNTNKGTFGHLSVIIGTKAGAGMLCAKAGFALGVGLVSVIEHQQLDSPSYIMQSHNLPENTTAIAIGMGLGNYEENEVLEILQKDIPKIIDADLFYEKEILEVLDKNNTVLTPHPKEFCSLLKITNIANIEIKELQKNRFKYVNEFCKKYPNIVLLLKGANVLIGQDNKIFINPHGTNKLSFGGSGDVLGGFIGSLLAQGYNSLDAAIQGSLIHTKCAINYKKNDYSMTPEDLIEEVKTI